MKFLNTARSIVEHMWLIAAIRRLLIGLAMLYQIQAFAQRQVYISFTHLTTTRGLSQSTVNCILKDRFGFMWFGTQDGLNRYDGYNFQVYRNGPGDTSSISSNYIQSIVCGDP